VLLDDDVVADGETEAGGGVFAKTATPSSDCGDKTVKLDLTNSFLRSVIVIRRLLHHTPSLSRLFLFDFLDLAHEHPDHGCNEQAD